MKHATPQQVEQIKTLHPFSKTNFHKNTKRVGFLMIDDYKEVISKKINRQLLKHQYTALSDTQLTHKLIISRKNYKNTPYHKIMIVGHTHIYLASPVYEHNDYNKTRLFPITTKTLKLMRIFNSIINR